MQGPSDAPSVHVVHHEHVVTARFRVVEHFTQLGDFIFGIAQVEPFGTALAWNVLSASWRQDVSCWSRLTFLLPACALVDTAHQMAYRNFIPSHHYRRSLTFLISLSRTQCAFVSLLRREVGESANPTRNSEPTAKT